MTAAVAVLSLSFLGTFAVLAPANAVWANETPGTLDVRPLPTRLVEPAQAPKPSLDEIKIPDLPETQPQARSLTDLVAELSGRDAVDREAECLAVTVYFESKGESLDGQLAVAQTVLNRTRSGRFPSSICGVVFQPGQFSFVRGNGFPPIVRTGRQWQTALAIAHIAINDLWTSTVDNALYFHARRVNPGWRAQRIATLGNHVFYR